MHAAPSASKGRQRRRRHARAPWASRKAAAHARHSEFHAIPAPSSNVRAPDGMEQSNGSASEGWNLAHGRTHTFVPMGSPHDGETSNAGELNVNTKVRPYPSTGSIATTQRAGAWVIEPLSEAGFVAIILSRHVDCRLWEHKWMAWWPSAQAQQLKCAHACLNARVRVPCKRAAHLHASEKALGPAAACARERCIER